MDFQGFFKIEVKNVETGETRHFLQKNTLTSKNVDWRNETLSTPNPSDHAIKFLAFGTGNTAPSPANVRLEAEIPKNGNDAARVAWSTQATTGDGFLETVFILPSNSAATNGFTISEIGVFCGASATDSEDTGELMARVVLSSPIAKTAAIQVQFTRLDRTDLT